MSRAYDLSAWRGLRREAVERHVAVRGWTCPGWGKPAHDALDLTADHVLPVSRGGLSTRANVEILCRSCNARKGARIVREQLELFPSLPRRWRYPG